MRNYVSALIALSCAASPSLVEAKNFSWSANAEAEDKLVYQDGNPVIIRDKGEYYIRVMPSSSDFYGRPMFTIDIGNRGLDPFNFGPENISISFDGGESSAALSRQELIAKVNNKAGWAAFATGMLGGSTSSQTTVRTPYGTYNSRTSSPSQDYARINNAASSVVNAINQNAFATNTIPTGKSYAGAAIFEKPKTKKQPSEVALQISISGNVETFRLNMRN